MDRRWVGGGGSMSGLGRKVGECGGDGERVWYKHFQCSLWVLVTN